MSILTQLVAFLGADAGVAALIGDRIYPSPAPQGATYPCVTYQTIASTHEENLAGASTLSVTTVQIDVWARTMSSADAVAEAVRYALAGYSGDMGGARVERVFVQSRQDSVEFDEDGGEVVLRRSSRDVDLWHRSTVQY